MRKFVQHTGSATDTRNMPHAAVTVLVFVLCIYSAKAAPVDDILPEDAAVNSNTSPWSTTSGDTDYRISVTTDEDRNEDTNTSSLTLQYAKQMAKVLVSVLQHLEKEKSTGLAKRSHKKSQLLPNPFDRMRRGRHQNSAYSILLCTQVPLQSNGSAVDRSTIASGVPSIPVGVSTTTSATVTGSVTDVTTTTTITTTATAVDTLSTTATVTSETTMTTSSTVVDTLLTTTAIIALETTTTAGSVDTTEAPTTMETTVSTVPTTQSTLMDASTFQNTEQSTIVATSTVSPVYGCLNTTLCPANFSGTMEIACDNLTKSAQCEDGWLIFLKRTNDDLNFNRTWAEYKTGFGNASAGDYWLGLELLSQITNSQNSNATLKVDMVALPSSAIYIQYSLFRVAEEEANYGLYLDGYSGNVTQDSFANITQGLAFSTFDRDNAANTGSSCALSNGGGWWYENCAKAQFTAHYSRDSICRSDVHRCIRYEGTAAPGVNCGLTCMLSSATMKLRLRWNFTDCFFSIS
ncbi:tenascin-R-like [Lingula anatina]|uniref:Tenascin-R-like n=1 Tax=Lingula anatina TaxID=7574 RepID=A0A1S3JND2_LINAN|nr:tenascin-R-like [Lingula anatina]|eukprot:XP_013411875.1 tenascin-R-like [Lingula anatina]